MILLVATLALWSTGFLLAARAGREAPSGKTDPARGVSVIIPARNEEQNLPRLLRSLKAEQAGVGEIIVVDDGSTDNTAAVAREFGATVIQSAPLPEGWRGKTWACHQGARAAAGSQLLFVDADAWFEPGGLARLLAAYPGGAFSAGPFHAVRKLHEELSLFFNLNMAFGTRPDGLFGQSLLVDRASYERVGGHEAVRGRVLENFWLASRFKAAGIPTRSVSGRGIIAFRMYPNHLLDVIQGWTKGFASGARQTPRGALVLLVAWMSGLMMAPLAGLITGNWLCWFPVYLVCVAQVAWISRPVGSFRLAALCGYPVALLFFFVIFTWSAARSGRTVQWKGREIRAD